MLLGGSRANLRPGVVVVYQRRRVNARTSVATTSVTPNNGPTSGAVVVVVIVQTLMKLLTGCGSSGRCWQRRFDGRIQLLMDLLLVMLMRLLLVVDEMLLLLLLLLLDDRSSRRGHGQQTLPVVANDLPLVLRILVRRPGHVAVAQGRWRRRMARASGVAAAAAATVTVAVMVAVAVVVVVVAVAVVRRMVLVAAATVSLILDLCEEKVLLVAVLFRFAGAQMCVSDVGRNLRTGRVDDTTTLPGAFVDRLAGPSLPRKILVIIHADAFVRVGERGRPGATNHNCIGGTVVVTVTVTFATSVSIALVGIVAIARVVAVVVRWCGMSVLAERRRRRAGAPRGAAAAGAGPQDGFPAGRRRVGRAGQTHKYQGSVAFVRRVLVVNTVILPIVL